MSEYLRSQGLALVSGINASEPYIHKIHREFEEERFGDWPTVVLATTLQTSAISLFKLLPKLERTGASAIEAKEPLDMRSIASIVRNIIDTHDAIDMFVNFETSDKYELHRNILGFYLSSRIGKIQDGIDIENAENFYKNAPVFYWEIIKKSPLYKSDMNKLKSGESIYYETRKTRIEKVCGKDSDFVSGVLVDLSTYVHSVPPAVWMGKLSEIYTDNEKNRDMVAIWIRVSNVYYAHGIKIILEAMSEEFSNDIHTFVERHTQVFQ